MNPCTRLPKPGVLALSALLCVVGGVSAAQAATISCPVSRIDRDVTTALPGEWRALRNANRLTGTRVAQISGRDALICEYGSTGTVQRYAPDGNTCTAISGGFNCNLVVRPIPVPLPGPGAAVHSSGSLTIQQTYQADLDRGRIGSSGADIWFRAVTASRKYIEPVNDTFISAPSNRARGLDGCLSAPISANRININRVPIGSFICYETRAGRIGEFQVIGLTGPSSNQRLRINYTTWR